MTIANPRTSCYFDVRVAFPAGGTVRLGWSYPAMDPMLGYFDPSEPHSVVSRPVKITLH